MTKLASLLAWIIVVVSSIRLGVAVFLAFGSETIAENEASSRIYLGAANSGEAINEELLTLLVGVLIGVFASISRNVEDIKRYLENKEGNEEWKPLG